MMLKLLIAGVAAVSAVPRLEFFTMSQCPDTYKCQTVLAKAILEAEGQMDLKLNFIGRLGQAPDLTCPHGNNECLGNMQQLCQQHNYGGFRAFEFAACQDVTQTPGCEIPRGWHPNYCVPANGPPCADLTGNPIARNCLTELGPQLMEQSYNYSAAINMRISCSVRLTDAYGKVVLSECAIDGGKWSESCAELGVNATGGFQPEHFKRAICSASTPFGRRSAYCTSR